MRNCMYEFLMHCLHKKMLRHEGKDEKSLKEEKKTEFKPFISADSVISEFTVTSVILGILLAIVFGAANAYLGLRVGMTVSASIPAAVVSMGVIRIILKKDSILENNLVQTIGSAGESVAAGAIFTIPALFLWAEEWQDSSPGFWEIFFLAGIGGLLGILFMIPLRKALIVKEHEVLPYPEGTACAKVLLAGEAKGKRAGTVFYGLSIAGIYKFITDGLKVFPSQIHIEITKYKGGAVGIDVLPALVGVGYICGSQIAAYMLAGGICGWLCLQPLISLFGGEHILFPAAIPISHMTSQQLWSNYIKYIGAGAVAAGGIISLIKSLPLIGDTFVKTIKNYKNTESEQTTIRTNRDLPNSVILIGICLLAVLMWLLPVIPVNFFSAILIIFFGFLFATVSSRLVGLVGSSNNPVSGMTIATLLLSSFLLKSMGITGREGMITAIAIGSVICMIAAVAGDTSQDLKTGYLLGATPAKQQIGELIGVLAASLAIGGVLYLLNMAWGYGSTELPALQATLMKMIVEGVMNTNLPWNLVWAGAILAIVIEILRIPVLPFAVGLYLPIHLSAGIMVGGLVRLAAEKIKVKGRDRESSIESGILYSSGMIAGEGLIGILLAVLAIISIKGQTISEWINIAERISLGEIGAFAAFVLLIGSLLYHCMKKQ